MKSTKTIVTSLIIVLGLTLGGCGLLDDADDLEINKLPKIENTTGDDGGTGGETPPPGG